MYSLEIKRVSRKDAGLYEIQAVNSEGEVRSSANVTVLPIIILPAPIRPQPSGIAPKFLQLFTDRKSTLGSTVQFEARLTGTQPLNVS